MWKQGNESEERESGLSAGKRWMTFRTIGNIGFWIFVIIATMNRWVSIALVLCYFGISSGVSLNFHYCGDRFDSVSLAGFENVCCCGPDKDVSCCSSELLVLQSDEDQHPGVSLQVPQPMVAHVGWSSYNTGTADVEAPVLTQGRDPPPDPRPPLFIQYSRLTYYG